LREDAFSKVNQPAERSVCSGERVKELPPALLHELSRDTLDTVGFVLQDYSARCATFLIPGGNPE
jgi:hypothetical protein